MQVFLRLVPVGTTGPFREGVLTDSQLENLTPLILPYPLPRWQGVGVGFIRPFPRR